MADTKSAAGLPDVKEKEHGDGSSPETEEASENGMPLQEVERMREQLKVHIETIGFLLAEKTELEAALTESQESAEAKEATVEELQKRLSKFSQCSVNSDGKCACTASYTDQANEMQRLVSEFNELQSKFNRTTDERSRIEVQLRMQTEELNALRDERETLRREHVQFAEQQAKTRDEAMNVLKMESETLRREHARQVEELNGKLKLLEQEVSVLRNEKESLTRGNAQMMEQLREMEALVGERTRKMEELENWARQRDEGLKEVLGERERLQGENARLEEQLRLRESSVGDRERQMEQLMLGQRKQMEAQVSLLLNEKDQALGRCDELQSLLEDLRLRYAVANEELSQSNETTQIVTDEYNKLKDQLDHANRIAEAHANESHELSRRLDERVESVRKLENTVERLNSAKTEHGNRLENRKIASNGNSDDHGNPGVDNDLFEKYSNDVLEHLRQNAPLIDRLQKELSSAQDTINALTNQNSELKNRTRSNSNLNEADALQSLSRVEMERNRLKEELEQLRRQHRSLEEKMELTEEDLARQVPVNGDVVVRSQFEALQSVMKRLEGKYTQVMRDKADLMDTTERLEHIITQLQDESNTIGEYVSLYHHQRFVQRQRTAEKDGYIYQLAHERSALQNRLAQLQALIMRLLNEQHVLNASSNHASEQQVAGRESPGTEGHDLQQPGVVNGEGQDDSIPNTDHHHSSSSCESCPNGSDVHSDGQQQQQHNSSTNHPQHANIPGDNGQTAQMIMHLLSEIGSSQLVDGRPFEDRSHVKCSHCSGRILIA